MATELSDLTGTTIVDNVYKELRLELVFLIIAVR